MSTGPLPLIVAEREPPNLSGMERGRRLARDDEQRGDVGEEGWPVWGCGVRRAEAAGLAGFEVVSSVGQGPVVGQEWSVAAVGEENPYRSG